MISKFHVSDRNVVGLLLILREDNNFNSGKMVSINMSYGNVRDAAVHLRDAGLLTSEESPDRKGKTMWSLTPEGRIVADSLAEAESGLNKAMAAQKYYKQ